ncbi:hypothetical protein [Chitinophaga sp. S165]|uniref:hypothetical protein n=1 Tax=Chitinophaga sp. S165 TaxID=2135462 RepID=UPI000D7164A7|nr:hypothetical protein [Chitinophaga sp. S165]PWV47673.1 hypothetical protein C7475_108240 [Chitinophaga sp. S165]
MTIERINHLYQEGAITSEEHNELINRTITAGAINSPYSYLTLFFALAGYFSMLTFTKNGNTIFSIFSNGNQRLWAGMICSALGLAVFAFGKFGGQTYYYKEHYAYIGIGIIAALLMINIPVLLFS